MLHISELCDRDVVYTWENPDPPGGVRMWAVERMERWCRDTDREIFRSDIDHDRAQWFVHNRGIEEHRVKWLLNNPEKLLNPCLMMRLTRGTVLNPEGTEHWDLMLDGHHRYVALSMLRHPIFRLWHLTEEEGKMFEIFGHPQPTGPLNVNAFSGLGLDEL